MTNRIPDYLKLHLEEPQTPLQSDFPELERLRPLVLATTGYRLTADESDAAREQLTFTWLAEGSNRNESIRIVEIERRNPSTGPEPLESSTSPPNRELALAVAEALNQLQVVRSELRRREAELATSVPVVSVDEDGIHLADRLEGVLNSAVQMTHSSAAALYLLDEATTSLKLRSSVGLSPQALACPARPLELAIGDLEAMSGHALVVEDARANSHWNVPESAGAAMCVPVASATSILGTLWLFRDRPGDFYPSDQDLAEVLAGRIASDLERTVLVQEVRQLRMRLRFQSSGNEVSDEFNDELSKNSHTTSTSISAKAEAPSKRSDSTPNGQQNGQSWEEYSAKGSDRNLATSDRTAERAVPVEFSVPRVPPELIGWDVAEATRRLADPSSRAMEFTHWWLTRQDQLRLTVGAQHAKSSRDGCLATAVTAHVQHELDLDVTLSAINQTLWSQSVSGIAASLFHGSLDTTTGSLRYVLHGGIHAYLLRPHGWEPLLAERTLLGRDDAIETQCRLQVLMPGDILFAISYPSSDRDFESDQRMNQVAEKVLRHTHLPAQLLAELALRTFGKTLPNDRHGIATLIAKRSESA